MAKHPMSVKAKTKLTKIAIPVSKPRNPIAVNPLLKKSGAHLDRRVASKIDQAKSEIARLKKNKRTAQDDES